MQISLLLMEEIAKLFAIMLMGYAVVKAGLMKSSESKSISVVMVYLVIPCVIIDAFQVDYTPDVQKGLLLACAAAVLVHVLFLILTTILKQVLQLDTIERATVCYLFKCRDTGNSAGTGFAWTGVRYLLQCLYCGTADSDLDTLQKYALRRR